MSGFPILNKSQPHGLKKYVRRYNNQFIEPELLQKSIDNRVTEENCQVASSKGRKSKPDDEGWVTVTKNDKHSFPAKRSFGNTTSSP